MSQLIPGPGLFRLFLALVVVLHHSSPLRLGAWAVGLFFCLSGYWIAEMWALKYSLLDRPYVEFLVSRWWRLMPVLATATLLAAAAFGSGLLPGDAGVLRDGKWWATQPAIAGSSAFGRLLPPTWSLDVEMQFYLAAPLLVILAGRLNAGGRAILVVSALAWSGGAAAWGAGSEAARLDLWLGVFLIGVIASVGRLRFGTRAASASALATLALFAVATALPATRPWLLLRGSDGPGLSGWLPACLTLLAILLSAPFALSTTARASRTFDRMLGDLSYPLYLFHWLPREWYYARPAAHSLSVETVALLGVNVAASLAGGLALLWLVDRPAQRLRAAWVRRREPPTADSNSALEAPFAGTT